MANVNGVGSSSYSSSIYGNRNILSGLASGLDTESMIENSVMGYKTKIERLISQQTKLSWKQDAYRSITDKMIALTQGYTSYTSKTNLRSPSFFNNSVITTTSGKNADKISATGKSTSDVSINAVKQLATAAKYSVDAGSLFGVDGAATGEAINLSDIKVSKVSGSMTLSVGNSNKNVTLDFGQGEAYPNAAEFVHAINAKLSEQKIGETKASDMIKAELKDGKIVFSAGEKAQSGDAVWVSGASGNIQKELGLEPVTTYDKDKAQSSVDAPSGRLFETVDAATALSNKTISVTLDGVTKKVSLGDLRLTAEEEAAGTTVAKKLEANLQSGLKDAFGSKVEIAMKDGALSFTTSSQGSSLKVSSSEVGSMLGLGSSGVSNYLDTSKKLGQILGADMGGLTALDAVGDESKFTTKDGVTSDEAGNTVMKVGESWKRVDNNGKLLYGMEINGKQVGAFTEDTALESVITAINRSDAGVKVNYSRMTNKFTFTATETGSQGRVDFGEGMATKLFGGKELNYYGSSGILADGQGNKLVLTDDEGAEYVVLNKNNKYYKAYENGKPIQDSNKKPIELTQDDLAAAGVFEKARKGYTAGQDAIFSVSVNGEEMTLTRSSNIADIDGLSVTLKGVFNDKDADGNSYFTQGADGKVSFTGLDKIETDSQVSFTSKADADKIVDAVKKFVDEYNAIITETRSAYNTSPLYKNSKKERYDPLTDEQKEGMSDSEIEKYEEKAKTGVLFGDSDLRRAYDSLRNAISVYGDDRKAMESIGLTTEYSHGVTTLALDETKLREALDSNPDSVARVFTQSRENGDATDGLMARVKKTMDTYSSTSIGKYGVLVSKAGTKTSSLTLMNNNLQKQINNLDDQIDRWQGIMSDKIDYYTNQFTRLEQLMQQFNSQSSTLAGLMGGGY